MNNQGRCHDKGASGYKVGKYSLGVIVRSEKLDEEGKKMMNGKTGLFSVSSLDEGYRQQALLLQDGGGEETMPCFIAR